MTGLQETSLLICVGCAALTLVVHLIVRIGWAASLVALMMCVGAMAFEDWLEWDEATLWPLGLIIAGGLAAVVSVVVSVVCILVWPGPSRRPTAEASTGDDGKRL